MRKHFVIGMCAMLTLGLTACGSGGDKPSVTPPATKVSNDAGVPQPAYDNNNPMQEGNQPTRVVPVDQADMPNLTTMLFEEYNHNFGVVETKGPNEHVFKFTNTGDNPLTITHAQASCGCTVPEWPKEPILPGKGGEIKVVFTPKDGQAGKPVTKTVTVKANVDGGSQQLTIKAKVKEA